MDYIKELKISSVNDGACSGFDRWLHSEGTKELPSINPTTSEVIAKVRLSSAENYETIAQDAQRSFLEWCKVPAPKRGELIRQIGNVLREKKDVLGSLVAIEMGKSKQEGDGEVQEMIDMADLAVGQSRMLYGKTMPSERPEHRMYEQWHPLGVVGVITAFNFPVAVWAWNAFIAAVAGNTVIWKPSSKTPLCAIAVQHICNQVMKVNGFQGVFSLLISNDANLAEKFVADRRISLISFTGSTRVGRKVNEIVAKRLGRSILELSGNNAIIVDQSANLDLAVPAIVFGAVGTAGQRCTTTRRLFIHEALYESLIEKLTHAYQQIRVGNPLEKEVLMGPLIDQSAVESFVSTIKAIQSAGGKILFGGNALPGLGFFVEPTIATAENSWEVVQRETFAPILYVMKFKTLDQAVAMQNAVAQGLSSALFTENLSHAERFLAVNGSDCGIANINIGTSGAEIGGAFGGEKDTGGGREAGSDIWKFYMRRQTNTINWGKTLPLAQGINFSLTSK